MRTPRHLTSTIMLALTMIMASAAIAWSAAGFSNQMFKIHEPSLVAGNNFAISSDFDGQYAVIGAPNNDEGDDNAGAAYIYKRRGNSLEFIQKLVSPDADNGDAFGVSVAIDGDYVSVGAYRDDSLANNAGAAYIFERNSDGDWLLATKLTASDGAASDSFGWDVDIDGNYAVVSSHEHDTPFADAGAAYVFERGGGGAWSEMQKLSASDGAANDGFSVSVAIDSTQIMIGAAATDDNGSDSGSVYVFELQSGTWTQTAELHPSDNAAGDLFGYVVAMDGNTALVSAPGISDVIALGGGGYVYEYSGGLWTQSAKFAPSTAVASNLMGYTADIQGDTAVLGAPVPTTSNGAAYVFTRSSGTWNSTGTLITASDSATFDLFGFGVSVNESMLLIGAPRHDYQAYTDSGALYIYGQYTYYLPYFNVSATQFTGLALSNVLNNAQASIDVAYYNNSGSVLGTDTFSPLAYGQDTFIPSVVSGTGWALITSDQPISGAALSGAANAPLFDIDIRDEAAKELILPHLATEAGNWTSTAMICNPNSSAATVSLSYRSTSGTTPYLTQDVNIPAMGSVQQDLGSLFATTLTGGSVLISSTQPVAAFLLYDGTDQGEPWTSGISISPAN